MLGCEESCADPAHPSCAKEVVAVGGIRWDFLLNAARRKALKWISGKGMGNACKESTEEWGAGEELKAST